MKLIWNYMKMFPKILTTIFIYPHLCSTAHILELYNEEKFDNYTNNSHQNKVKKKIYVGIIS